MDIRGYDNVNAENDFDGDRPMIASLTCNEIDELEIINGLSIEDFKNSNITSGGVEVKTTAERDLMTPTNKTIIYNTTTSTFQIYNGSAWDNISKEDLTGYATETYVNNEIANIPAPDLTNITTNIINGGDVIGVDESLLTIQSDYVKVINTNTTKRDVVIHACCNPGDLGATAVLRLDEYDDGMFYGCQIKYDGNNNTCYIQGLDAGAEKEIINFSRSGTNILLKPTNNITMTTPTINLNGNVAITGTTLKFNNQNILTEAETQALIPEPVNIDDINNNSVTTSNLSFIDGVIQNKLCLGLNKDDIGGVANKAFTFNNLADDKSLYVYDVDTWREYPNKDTILNLISENAPAPTIDDSNYSKLTGENTFIRNPTGGAQQYQNYLVPTGGYSYSMAFGTLNTSIRPFIISNEATSQNTISLCSAFNLASTSSTKSHIKFSATSETDRRLNFSVPCLVRELQSKDEYARPNPDGILFYVDSYSTLSTKPKGVSLCPMNETQRDLLTTTTPTKWDGLLIFNTDQQTYQTYNKSTNSWDSMSNKINKKYIFNNYKNGIQGVYGDVNTYIESSLSAGTRDLLTIYPADISTLLNKNVKISFTIDTYQNAVNDVARVYFVVRKPDSLDRTFMNDNIKVYGSGAGQYNTNNDFGFYNLNSDFQYIVLRIYNMVGTSQVISYSVCFEEVGDLETGSDTLPALY